jgi:DNA-binding NarL/FixJ family response regulator
VHPLTRILIVDDFPAFRELLRKDLLQIPHLAVVGEASDGLEAVAKFRELRPDLILLDLGLPKLNGIEVARRITTLSPKAKILIVSANLSKAVIEEAFRAGASGYLVKSDVAGELRLAVESILAGIKFVSKLANDPDPSKHSHLQPFLLPESKTRTAPASTVGNAIPRRHHAAFYTDDRSFSDHVGLFIGRAIKAGNAAIVLATESHRSQLLRYLKALNLDLEAVSGQGRYIALDVADTVSKVTVNGTVDRDHFMSLFDKMLAKAKIRHLRIAVFGECAQTFLARGNPAAAIKIERLANELLRRYDVEILCGYSRKTMQSAMHEPIYEQICAEHSSIHTN